jgi:hypothetical protein
LAEADEDFSPYLYTSNNPVLNIDLFGLTDVNGDGKDDGTILPQVTVIAQRDESTLNNIQLTLDGIGLYPGAGTLAGVVNAGIDIYRGNYGSAGLNLLSAVPVLGTAMKATKFAVMGAKAMSSMAKMKGVKSALVVVRRNYKGMPSIFGMEKHHLLPQSKRFMQEFGFDLKSIKFNINEGYNIKYLDKAFHGNAPEYEYRVAEKLREMQANNTLTKQNILDLTKDLRNLLDEAYNDFKTLNGPTLNEAFR